MTNGRLIQSQGCILMLTAIILIAGCSSDSNPTGDTPKTRSTVMIPLEGILADIPVPANQLTRVTFTLQLPPDVGVVNAASLDVKSTLQHVSVVPGTMMGRLRNLVSAVTGTDSAQAWIRIGADPATVCDAGRIYGPYSVNSPFFTSPSPASIELDSSTIRVLNYGFVVVCMDITTTMDVTFSVDSIATKVDVGSCGTAANFAGVWNGTYECGDNCSQPFGGPISLTVTQSGTTATYDDDGGDHFTGKVCGNRFRFERIDPDEIERGTLTLIDAHHAVKHSTWRMRTYPFCTGDCTDSLTR